MTLLLTFGTAPSVGCPAFHTAPELLDEAGSASAGDAAIRLGAPALGVNAVAVGLRGVAVDFIVASVFLLSFWNTVFECFSDVCWTSGAGGGRRWVEE